MNQRAPNAPIAIGERVNSLKLGMANSSLNERAMRGAVQVVAQILH